MITDRFYIISEKYGLVRTCNDEVAADDMAIRAAVNSGRTVYVHDRLTEL